MSVLVVVQDAIDVAMHIAGDEAWGLPTSSAEAFLVLARNNVFDEQLASSLGDTVRLRNRIAHGYATVDVERLWNELPAGLQSFDAFAGAVAAFVDRQPA